MKKYIFLTLFGFLCVAPPHAHASYLYARSITVTSTPSIASGTQTNFPMLVASTLASWESSSTGAGAQIQNLCTTPKGGQEPCDLVFATSTNNCGIGNLSFETESYTSSTGALIDWVKMPTIATNTVIYACYGDSTVTTDQSHPSSTWNSNYVGVWHFPNGTLLNASDSTSNANNSATTTATAALGYMDGGAAVTSTQTMIVPSSASLNFAGAMTLDTWVYPTTSSTYQALIIKETNSSTRQYALDLSALGTGDLYFGGSGHKASDYAVNPGWAVNAWNHIAVAANGTTVNMYVNGALANSTATSTDASVATNQVSFGREATANLYELFGRLDEARIMKTAASSSWILTEYNNESSPNTFYTIGSEVSNPVPTTTSITPTSTVAGGGNFVIMVNGSNFIASSSVLWNGGARATTFISSSQLTAIVLGSDITATGTASVAVSNPAPGGGTSNTQTFTITNSLPGSAGPYNASGVLGHVDQNGNFIYTSGGPNNGPTPQGLNFVEGSALDLQNHRLFVADNTNMRILVFPLDANNNLATTSASYVLGLPTLYSWLPSGNFLVTASNTWNTIGLAYDPVSERLFEAEEANSRILVFNVATSTITNGETADYVLGSINFTSVAATSTQSGLNNPWGLAYDVTNTRLFTCDWFNNRVMVFNVATSTITNGENASYVLGQPNFTSRIATTTQSGLRLPPTLNYPGCGVDYDEANQRLFVADTNNNRVMVFNVATSTITNGENADYVLGQSNFISSSSATTQSGLSLPTGIAYDPSGSRVFVNDYQNHRTLVFNAATATIANGDNALNVLGQSDFISSSSVVTQSGISYPSAGLSYDPANGNLFVGDSEPVDRLMVFDAATSTIHNGENAYALLGHVDQSGNPLWTIAGPNNGPNAEGFIQSSAPALDAVGHRLFVADNSNSRILVFPLDAKNDLTTTTAAYVLGQADFTSKIVTTTQNSLWGGSGGNSIGITYDAGSQRLFVADNGNNRVLVFNVATSTITNGETANYVLGQPNFTSRIATTTQSGLSTPWELTYDVTNTRLFVAEIGNNRVMVFNVATSTITNGENASYVLGQPDFTTKTAATTQNKLGGQARGLDYDVTNERLFVADLSNNRVLVFNVATSTITNGENASYVLGQPNFTSKAALTTQSGVSSPVGVAYDPTWSRLFIGDEGNQRVLVFNVATSTITNGENALNILGQPDFTSRRSGPLLYPTQSNFGGNLWNLAYDPAHNRLFASDYSLDRIMAFTFVTITTLSLPQGAANAPYSAPVLTTSTQGIVNFVLYNSSLPPGLFLDSSSGVISGVPTIPGTYFVTVEADDTFTTGNFFDRATYTLTIASSSPSVSITSPINGATVTSTITVAATASSTNGATISSVQFLLDGAPLGAAVTSSPYQVLWNTTQGSDGIHVLTASTTDENLNVATSSPVSVTVQNTITNPVPTTTSLSPTSTAAGGGNFTLAVNGTNFIASSSVLWNGSARATTFISSSSVTATILTADIAAAGTSSVTVSNPAPGGGTSNAQTFTITNQSIAATPTFSPGAGTYTSTQSVTISCTTPSSTLYYTTDGSIPTASSTPYTTPVSVAFSETLNAICTAAGYANSAVGSAIYVIQSGNGGGGGSVGVGGGGSSYSIAIDGGAPSTATTSATLSLYGTSAYTMEIANTADFAGATWEPYATMHPWILTGGAGTKTIYARFRSVNGGDLGTVSASIELLGGTATSSTTLALQAQIAALQAELQSLLARVNGNNSGTGTGFSSSYVFTRNLGLWDTGADVQTLQALLINHHAGPAAQTLAAHGTTKFFGVLTYRALKEFQKSVGIPATGYFGPLTRAYLTAHE
jgi:DNA-binding beta-propeller fold protein YncE